MGGEDGRWGRRWEIAGERGDRERGGEGELAKGREGQG